MFTLACVGAIGRIRKAGEVSLTDPSIWSICFVRRTASIQNQELVFKNARTINAQHTDGEVVIMLAFQASGTGSIPVQCITCQIGLFFFCRVESMHAGLPHLTILRLHRDFVSF